MSEHPCPCRTQVASLHRTSQHDQGQVRRCARGAVDGPKDHSALCGGARLRRRRAGPPWVVPIYVPGAPANLLSEIVACRTCAPSFHVSFTGSSDLSLL